MSDQPFGPKRKRRITRACDQCHRRNTKCAPGPSPSTCLECHEFGSVCTYDRPVRRRGPRTAVDADQESSTNHRRPLGPIFPVATWVYQELATLGIIKELAESYHAIVYPIFPLFHWPTFLSRLDSLEHTTDQAFFIATMAVCAIVTARLRNGAISVPHPSTLTPTSEQFARAAINAFPPNLVDAKGFEYIRAKALLAILQIQYGNVAEHRTHLGEYVVLSSNEGFQDETRWPGGLGEAEMQERRRVFWSIYTLEIYSALTWGGTIRFRENQSNVLYPFEVDDEMIPSNASYIGLSTDISFMRGWNFTTDMYRMLEHLLDRLRSVKPIDHRQAPLGDLFLPRGPSSKDVLDRLASMHSNLPAVFKTVREMTGNIQIDRFGFQAANIIVTMQTVKLTVAAAEDQGVEERCMFASELVQALATIPTAYIAAVSRPMLHHLASCGHLLGSVVNRPLSQRAMLQVRSVLVSMVDILSALEFALNFPADISSNLRTHVSRVEGYLAQASWNTLPTQGPLAVNDLVTNPPPSPPIYTYNPFEDPEISPGFRFELPQEHQASLQSDLTAGWPLDFGGGVFDFLADGPGWDTSGSWLFTDNNLAQDQ